MESHPALSLYAFPIRCRFTLGSRSAERSFRRLSGLAWLVIRFAHSPHLHRERNAVAGRICAHYARPG